MSLDDVVYPAAFATKKNDNHWKPGEVTWGEIQDWMKHPRSRKDVDGYILASLTKRAKVHVGADHECDGGYHRDSKSLERRSALLMIDVDKPDEDFEMVVDLVLDGHAYILHTTYSSTPSEPRYRLLVPVDRDMSPHEYVDASKSLSQRVGIHQVDAGTWQATRFMYKPSARKPEWFDYTVADGEPIPVDDLLDTLEIVDSDSDKIKPGRTKRNPFEIEGLIGVFNRVYTDWDEVIEIFDLPYERESEGRWHLRDARSQGGLTTIPEPGFVNSFHAHDPAYGLNHAFDLVRLHRFGDLDSEAKPDTPVNRLPSTEAMLDLARKDPRVVDESFKQIEEDFDRISQEEEDLIGSDAEEGEGGEGKSWKSTLRLSRSGKFMDIWSNWQIILRNDPVFRVLRYNELTMSPEATGDLPWREVTPLSRTFDGMDTAALMFHLEENLNEFRPSKELVERLIQRHIVNKRINPVRDYLESLVWDGVERISTSLPGATDTQYNRMVATKVLVGAVARVFDPGCKWDHTLVLYGEEGLGKTTWIERLANVGEEERRSYLYTLGQISQKDTLLAAHMSWIVTADEGHSLRKSDNDAMKEFLTRSADLFRMPYERDTVMHPRKFVIWATTNDETFLRLQQGNRRFLMVRCGDWDIDGMTPEYVDQLWAEAVTLYRDGYRIWLNDEESELARFEREPFTEEDSHAGIIKEYLDTLVPENWWTMSKMARIAYIQNRDPEFDPEGTMPIDRVCTHQLWEEAFGQRIAPSKVTLRELSEALKRLGWIGIGTTRIPGYGPQATFVRKDDLL